MSYAVKELFLTLQGEGAQAGRAAVFCRFAGCNLWSGHEVDRATAVCRFCDTDFVGTDGPGGGRFESAGALADAARDRHGAGRVESVADHSCHAGVEGHTYVTNRVQRALVLDVQVAHARFPHERGLGRRHQDVGPRRDDRVVDAGETFP